MSCQFCGKLLDKSTWNYILSLNTHLTGVSVQAQELWVYLSALWAYRPNPVGTSWFNLTPLHKDMCCSSALTQLWVTLRYARGLASAPLSCVVNASSAPAVHFDMGTNFLREPRADPQQCEAVPCSFCANLQNQCKLQIHEKQAHRAGRFECSICEKRFPNEANQEPWGAALKSKGTFIHLCGKTFARDSSTENTHETP